jgi:hypothetical protein
MKLEDLRTAYEYFSGKASDLCRQYALAGIAIIWIFKKNDGMQNLLLPGLRVPAFLMLLVLIFDLLHYLVAWAMLDARYRREERKNSDPKHEFTIARRWNVPAYFFFAAKVLTVIAGYVFIFIFLWKIL